MKVLMLGWELPPHNSGGLGVACLHLSKSLADLGEKIDFVVPYLAPHPEIKHMNVISATKLAPFGQYGISAYDNTVFEKKIDADFSVKHSIRDVQKMYQEFVGEFLHDHQPNIIHAHDWLTYEAGVLAKKQAGVPLIAHVHSTEFDRSGGERGNELIHEIEYQGLIHADRIIAVSENTRQIVHQKYQIPLEKIEVAYNSLGDDYLKSEYKLADENYNYFLQKKAEGFKIISTVGRFTVQKGLCNMMRAAALAVHKNSKLFFIFAGDGEQRNELINMAADLGIAENVFFTGFVRGKKLRDVYAISDIFVMSSISEPFGLTALEAAHHKNALIITKQSGVSEILHFIMKYDFWDEQKLADEILAVTENEVLLRELRGRIGEEYHRISWDDVAKKCRKIYNEIKKHKRDRY